MLCEKPVKGRSDKKFCNDFCRNSYNNRARSQSSHSIKIINKALLKNRRILQRLLGETGNVAKASREMLLEQGFQFRYTTHNYATHRGKLYWFCYDHGYMELEKDRYLIVKGVTG